MGTVYRAREKMTGKAVALKVYTSGTAVVLDRIQTEMSTLRTLDHPNLIQIINLGRANDQLFVATKLLDGPTLALLLEKLEQRAPVEIPSFGSHEYYGWIKQVFAELCSAVGYLHARNIVHGDIKPSNIIWADGRVNLLDFGLDALVESHRYDQDAPTRVRTEPGPFLGTAGYLSPGRLMGRREHGPTIDVYSLGKVLEVLWTLKHPSWEDNLNAVHRHEKKHSQEVSIKRPKSPEETSSEILKIVGKATMTDPTLRYQSVDQMVADFELAAHFYADNTRRS